MGKNNVQKAALLLTLFLLFFDIVHCQDKTAVDTKNDSTGTITDSDGNIYKTVKIGNQWWMAENLRVTHYNNGDSIPKVTDYGEWANINIGASCAFANDEEHAKIYGYLYNWYAVDDERLLAPKGWHVPTDDDWKILEMTLGMSKEQADAIEWRGTDEGNKLKVADTVHWFPPNAGATDETGFSALGGGYRNVVGTMSADVPGYHRDMAVFWTSTVTAHALWKTVWVRGFRCNDSRISRSYFRDKNMNHGFSIRCVKDTQKK